MSFAHLVEVKESIEASLARLDAAFESTKRGEAANRRRLRTRLHETQTKAKYSATCFAAPLPRVSLLALLLLSRNTESSFHKRMLDYSAD